MVYSEGTFIPPTKIKYKGPTEDRPVVTSQMAKVAEGGRQSGIDLRATLLQGRDPHVPTAALPGTGEGQPSLLLIPNPWVCLLMDML